MVANGYSYFYGEGAKIKIHFVNRQKLRYISCTINILIVVAMFKVHEVYLTLLHFSVFM